MSDEKILVKVEGVSKKFCRSLKKSLFYGIKDIASELNPLRKNGSGGAAAPEANPPLRKDEFWAVNNVSFKLRRGECMGLIGRNGAGKTTLLKMLNGLIKPDHGRIEMHGRVGALIALGAGFNPILTGRENIYVNGSILGLSQREIEAKIEEIIDFADVREFIDSPVQGYSSGMNVRLGFAVATALEPDILIVDEVLAVGDFEFRWKCLERIKALKDRGVSIILVSHNSHDLLRTCARGHVLQHGFTRFNGPITEAVLNYEMLAETHSETKTLATARNGGAAVSICAVRFQVEGGGGNSMKPGQSLNIEVEIQSEADVAESRVVIGLFHTEQGALFHISSYLDNQWIKLSRGRNKITLRLKEVPVQFGAYYAEASVRGPKLGDIYDVSRSTEYLRVTEPVPNFEGFGINGWLMPQREWKVS